MGTSSRRSGVSICGVGAVTGYGWGQKLLRQGLISGESAVRLTPGFGTHFDTDEVWVALIEEGGDPADGKSLYARATRHAVREAFDHAYDRGWRPGEVVGLIDAVVLADVGSWPGFHRRHGYHTSKKEWLNLMPSTLLSGIMQEYDMHGPNMMVTAMCASGVASLLTAKMWIDAGLATDCSRARHRPVGDSREHPGLQRPRCAHRRRTGFRCVPPVPRGEPRVRRRRGDDRDDRVEAAFGFLRRHPRRVDVARRVPRHLDKPGPQAGFPCLQGRPRRIPVWMLRRSHT